MRPPRVVKLQLVTLLVLVVSGASAAPTPSLSALLARHVPILVLHPVESFGPVPVDGFLADSRPQGGRA